MRLMLLAAAVLLPAYGFAAPCPKADPQAVVKAMTDMYSALTVDDAAGLTRSFTPDALEFDNGGRYTGSALWDVIKGVHAKGIRTVWTVQDTDVHFACNTAWIDYVNRGSFSQGTESRKVSWLESAVLVHDGRGWRIRFFHSTTVPDAAPAK